ncbi:Rieske (2Fe-2S) protein [Bradyrhizobium murdochi]|uniref:Rieske (2Fe-2S) protein n=1 Tax=Bradyrhizobium murdochi TaxID=1038859 RepID=UPI0009FBFF68|nr:Rieske (2Fe-2S) protein [Bradyrhizobium murdochi]
MPVCGFSRLISETIVCVRVTGVDLILVWSEGRAVACERMCPHEQADLSLGHLSGGRLFCPRHAASFDLRNGRISYGWPSRPLRLYPIQIRDDQVWMDAGAIKTPIIQASAIGRACGRYRQARRRGVAVLRGC